MHTDKTAVNISAENSNISKFIKEIDNTTYDVYVHFNKTGKRNRDRKDFAAYPQRKT